MVSIRSNNVKYNSYIVKYNRDKGFPWNISVPEYFTVSNIYRNFLFQVEYQQRLHTVPGTL